MIDTTETLPVLDWTHGQDKETYDLQGRCTVCYTDFIVRRTKGIQPPLSVDCPNCKCTIYSWRHIAVRQTHCNCLYHPQEMDRLLALVKQAEHLGMPNGS